MHRANAVTRGTQGTINLLINSEKEGFAHSHYVTHGPSVCAIALRVENASATLDRARKLLDTPFQGTIGPGELEIPAVRGMGGTLLYFTDPASELKNIWSVDFVPKAAAASDASLKTV